MGKSINKSAVFEKFDTMKILRNVLVRESIKKTNRKPIKFFKPNKIDSLYYRYKWSNNRIIEPDKRDLDGKLHFRKRGANDKEYVERRRIVRKFVGKSIPNFSFVWS